ncbi:hypothetical protein V8J08_004273 [Citrobacter amalonaticus]|uniref:hypothetical protein n=1 Tax=Citrobacter sp. CFNIH10 TaxID=1920110 RepID=UPI001B317891|nr:hypothetical protein [Citrobacter sp. CFNIH10]
MQKQTFSAKALGNEYATGVSRPAVLTTKAFLPHQRVTTEGKGMKTEMGVKVDVDVKRIKTCIKVCDRFTAEVIDSDGNTVRSIEDEYVPDCFPGTHYGDYLELDIDIETGQILNWKKPTPEQLSQLLGEEGE